MELQGTGEGNAVQPQTEVEHSPGEPRTITPRWDRKLEPAHGAIIDDPVAGVRCLVHSHHSDRSGRRLHLGNGTPLPRRLLHWLAGIEPLDQFRSDLHAPAVIADQGAAQSLRVLLLE